jgi:hypothetical protein
MKGQKVAVDQAANIGIQFQGETKRPSGPAFIVWSIPTKRTLADAAGKAGDADNGPIGAALTARSSNYFPRSQATKAPGAGMGPWDPFGNLSNRRVTSQEMVMCASHLLRIVDNVLPRETISRGAIIWLAMAAWTTLLPASQRSPAVRFDY